RRAGGRRDRTRRDRQRAVRAVRRAEGLGSPGARRTRLAGETWPPRRGVHMYMTLSRLRPLLLVAALACLPIASAHAKSPAWLTSAQILLPGNLDNQDCRTG